MTMANKWFANGKITSGVAVTPSDTEEVHFEAIWVGVGGDVAVQFMDDSAPVTLKNVADGEPIVGCITKVLSTGTTATDIVGLRIYEK